MIANIFIKDKPSGQSQELLQAVQVKNLIEDIKAGLGFINRHQLIFRIVQLTAAYSLISSFFYISILNYSNSVLNLASDGYGVLLAGLGLGLSCGALLLGKKKGKLNYNHILMFGFILLTCMNFMFIFKPGFGLSLVVLFIGGLGAASILVVLDSLLQRSTPDSLRANVFGARGIVNNFVFLLSLLIVGKLIAHIQVGFIFGFLSFFSLLVAFLIYLYEGNFGYRLVKNFLRFVLKNFFELKVTGYENLPATSKVILAGNHTSLLDGVILMAAYPKRIYFMAAESVFKNNSWGLIARQLGFIPVKKETANKEAIREAVRILESRNAIGIFPEGRITKTEQMVEGKKGVAVIAKKTNTPIIPFAIEGAYYAWPNIKERIKRHPIEVHFGKPLDVSQFEVPQELVDVVMDEIKNIKIEAEKKGLIDVNPNVIVKHLINYE
jgi:1-acyl-sn-glycerol-3-phosphate acyltransferase